MAKESKQLNLTITSNVEQVKTQLKSLEKPLSVNLHVNVTGYELSNLETSLKSIAVASESVESAFRTMNNAFANMGKSAGGGISALKDYDSAFSEITNKIKNLGTQKQTLDKILKTQNGNITAKQSKQISSQLDLIKEEEKVLKDMQKTFANSTGQMTKEHFDALTSRLDSASKLSKNSSILISEFDDISKAVSSAQNSLLDFEKVKNSFTKKKNAFKDKLDDNISNIAKEGQVYVNSQKALLEANKLINDSDEFIKQSKNKIASGGVLDLNDYQQIDNLKKGFERAATDIESSTIGINESITAVKKNTRDITGFDKIGNRLTDYFNKYQHQLSKNTTLYNKWLGLMDKTNKRSFGSVSEANREFAAFRAEARAAGVEIESFGTKLEKTFGTRIRSMISGAGVFALGGAVIDILRNVKEFDDAFTELKKVTDATAAEYAQFVEDAKARSIDLKSGLADVVSATASFSRLGYDIPAAENLSNTAIVYNNVADGIESMDDASNSIISTMQAFHVEAENSMSIADKFNEVGNRFATTSGGIGEGLQRSAAALHAGGNDIDESIALFTAGQTVLQDAASMGTVLKTTSMRLRGASTDEMQEAGLDTDNLASSVSKLRDDLLSLTGVDIQLDENTFKSTYQILIEIADVWDNLTDISRANVLEKLAGKRNANALAAIIENADIAREAYDVSANQSQGSALREQETWSKSLAGHLGELQAKWESFSTTIANSEGLKALIDLGGGVVSILEGMTKAFGSATILALPFIAALSKLGNVGKYALLQQDTSSCRMIAA